MKWSRVRPGVTPDHNTNESDLKTHNDSSVCLLTAGYETIRSVATTTATTTPATTIVATVRPNSLSDSQLPTAVIIGE